MGPPPQSGLAACCTQVDSGVAGCWQLLEASVACLQHAPAKGEPAPGRQQHLARAHAARQLEQLGGRPRAGACQRPAAAQPRLTRERLRRQPARPRGRAGQAGCCRGCPRRRPPLQPSQRGLHRHPGHRQRRRICGLPPEPAPGHVVGLAAGALSPVGAGPAAMWPQRLPRLAQVGGQCRGRPARAWTGWQPLPVQAC